MKSIEYDISLHPAAEFTQVAFYCSEEGLCNLEEVPANQVRKLTEILNERGRDGWELVQISFGKDGMMAFWKRSLQP